MSKNGKAERHTQKHTNPQSPHITTHTRQTTTKKKKDNKAQKKQ